MGVAISFVRIDEIPVRGLKLSKSPIKSSASPTSQNRRNPRQGIETQAWSRSRPRLSFVRIDEIPVRGLKHIPRQLVGTTGPKVRIDEIPVRGLKQNHAGCSKNMDLRVRIDEIPVRGLKLASSTFEMWTKRSLSE